MKERFGTGVLGKVYLVEEQINPSTDFFVLPAVAGSCRQVVRCGFSDLPSLADLDGAAVVFVRYVPGAWARLVEAVRPRLGTLAFFMDDDVLDTKASEGMPWRYRFKLARLSAWRRKWLQQQEAELWVSTQYLQKKYADSSPRLMLPVPLHDAEHVRRIFYHGSASHAAEIRWLRPVMEEVLLRDEKVVFEIAGGNDVYRLYRGLPRVTVVHPMKWAAYRPFLAMSGRHVGLAPQLDVPFNRARSYTKFFDITSCGAVGVYSPNTASAEVIAHGVEGLIVNLEQDLWAKAILKLAEDDSLRRSMLGNARNKLMELSTRAQQGHRGLAMTERSGDGQQ